MTPSLPRAPIARCTSSTAGCRSAARAIEYTRADRRDDSRRLQCWSRCDVRRSAILAVLAASRAAAHRHSAAGDHRPGPRVAARARVRTGAGYEFHLPAAEDRRIADRARGALHHAALHHRCAAAVRGALAVAGRLPVGDAGDLEPVRTPRPRDRPLPEPGMTRARPKR